tara:strand:- start:3734 stop:6247 length:2514 start_codon:yes stop_codon:yes gene_type:complete
MTSSFGNVIGTPRDRLPETGDNYARVEPDLTDAVNNEITKQQADTTEFYNQMVEIEKLKQQNFNDNLSGIADLLGSAVKFKDQLDADKEGREQLRDSKNLYKDKIKAINLADAEKRGEVLSAADTAFLLDARKRDKKAQELLNLKFTANTEEIGIKEFRTKTNTIVGGLSTYALNANLKDQNTEQEADLLTDKGLQSAVASAFLNAKRLGINVRGREFKMYFTRELYPKLIEKKEELLNAWESDNFRTFETKRTKRTDKYIATELSTAATNYKVDDPTTIVNLNDENTGLLTRLGYDFTDKFENPKDGINYLVDRVVALGNSGELSRYEIEFFKQNARFKHSDGRKELVTFKELGNKSDQARWGKALDTAMQATTRQTSEIVGTIKSTLEAEMRNRRGNNPDGELTDIDRIEIQAMGNKMARAERLEINNSYFPDGLLGDTTVSSGGERYSAKVGKADPLLGKVNITKDWVGVKRESGMNTTSLSSIETIEATKALGDLTSKVESAMSMDTNLTLDSAIAKFYPSVLADLAAGKYKDDYDFLVPTTPVDIRADQTTIKSDLNSVINQTGFISIHEKRGLENLAKYIEGGLQGEFPRYFEKVARGLNMTPREYAIARLKATGGIDANNKLIKNPLDKYGLTIEDRDYLLSFPNSTKNLTVLNGDDNVSKEAEMLKIFHDAAGNRKDDQYQAPPNVLNYRNRVGGDKKTVGELYDLAKKGADKFGRYNFSTQEFIDIVDKAGISKDAIFNEDTQSFMVIGLMRLQANKSNSITGAVTEGRNDWRRLTNLNIQEQEAVLQFFPNLRGMPNNEFQNLQADVAKAILDSVTTRDEYKDLVTP